MFGLFKKKSERELLEEAYKKKLKEAFDLSKINRSASDVLSAEAEEILKKIESISH
ncbi:MAG: Lacal_2735 family protein [Saprospiraceae bacterium]|nr:Lacal_2735 family protein [Saprospiraceae bacterium]